MNKHVADLVPPTVMVGIDKLRYASEAPKELNLQVRKSNDQAGLVELEASIRTHGIIVPLVTKEHKGTLYVTAGNRRLKLMRKIHGATGPGTSDINILVPTIDSDKVKGDPREIAMATNLGLPPHPVDRYEVISLLVREGMSPADAQAHFGLTPHAYNQVMRLGKMAPTIRDAWRDGEIEADVVRAFALSDDPKEQERVYASLRKTAYKGIIREHEVTSRFIGQQHGVGAMVEFVGIAACEKAKLKVNSDLFGTRHTVNDTKLLRRLVDQKLAETSAALCKDGWSFAMPEASMGSNSWQWGHIEPAQSPKPTADEAKRLSEIEVELSKANDADDDDAIETLSEEQERIKEAVKARGYSETQRGKSGCILKISTNGKLLIEYGRVRPEEKKRVEASERRKAAPAGKTAKKGNGSDVGTAALAERLSAALTRAAGMAIVREPSVAISALIAGFASRNGAVGVHISGDDSRPADFVKTFQSNIEGSTPAREMLLAQVAARALQFQVHNPDRVPLKDPAVAAVCNAIMPSRMNDALRECFDAKDYFGSITHGAIGRAVLESMGDEHAAKVGKMKRSEAAAFAIANVPKTKWLPPWLRTAHYDGPMKAAAGKRGRAARPPAPKKPAKRTAKKKAKRK